MNDFTKQECAHERHGFKIEEFSEYLICKHCGEWYRKTGEDLMKYRKYIDEALTHE